MSNSTNKSQNDDSTVDQPLESLEDLTSKKQRLRESLHHLEEKAGNIGKQAAEGGRYVRDRATAYQAGANEFLDSLSIYVKENPQRSAAIAASAGVGLGIIIGLLLRPRD